MLNVNRLGHSSGSAALLLWLMAGCNRLSVFNVLNLYEFAIGVGKMKGCLVVGMPSLLVGIPQF